MNCYACGHEIEDEKFVTFEDKPIAAICSVCKTYSFPCHICEKDEPPCLTSFAPVSESCIYRKKKDK